MPVILRDSFTASVHNVAHWGDTDIFPFPVENSVFFDMESEIVDVLVDIETNFQDFIAQRGISWHSALVPVGYTGFRWATQIDPIWNAYLLAAVIQIAPAIEALRIPQDDEIVYSYRLNSDLTGGLFSLDSWNNFTERTRLLASQAKFVVTVDIADFYARAYHHRIENALRGADPGHMVTKQIMTILGILSGNTSYGLPVGGPAARILAELMLNRVDRLIRSEPIIRNFTRYADDYRFFVDSHAEAYQAIALISEKLQRNEGLSLQKTKTRIMPSTEYLSMLDPLEATPGSAAQFLKLHVHYDPYSATAVDDYDQLTAELSKFDVVGLLQEELTKGRIHAALTKRLVGALQYLAEDLQLQAIKSLFENVEVLAPVLPMVLISVRECVIAMTPEAQVDLIGMARQLIIDGHYSTKIEINLSYLIRIIAVRHNEDSELLLIRLFSESTSPIVKRNIMLALGRWRVEYWLSDQKNYTTSMHPWVRRAFWLSSYALGDEGQHWRQANKNGLQGLDLVTRDWISSRINTPGWEIPL